MEGGGGRIVAAQSGLLCMGESPSIGKFRKNNGDEASWPSPIIYQERTEDFLRLKKTHQ